MWSRAQAALLVLAITLACSHGQVIASAPPRPGVAPAPPALVQPTCSSGQPGVLTVAGRGTAEATADVAEISLYVAITNTTAEGARTGAAGYASSVINSVRQINGISPDNVTTTSISVYPKTTYNSSEGSSTTVGYTYTNYISISLTNLTGDLLSDVLDTAVRNGGNNLTISSVSFSLSPGLSYNKTIEARMQAARDAQATAQQYAQGFGVSLGAILTVADDSYDSTPVQGTSPTANAGMARTQTSSGAENNSQTPVSIGKEQVSAAVSVTYTICSATT